MKQKSIKKMGSAPVKKLIISMGLPVILSMMLQALYNKARIGIRFLPFLFMTFLQTLRIHLDSTAPDMV